MLRLEMKRLDASAQTISIELSEGGWKASGCIYKGVFKFRIPNIEDVVFTPEA